MLGARAIPGIPADRAQLRTTLAYQFTERFSAGVEYNPLADDVGPIANWRVLDEGAQLPALVLGTSSGRIGSEEGRSLYATFVKSLDAWTGLPVAPYLGVSYDDFEEEFSIIGGLSIAYDEHWSSMHLWDGKNFHNLVERSIGDHSVGLLLAQQDDDFYLGLNWTWAFPGP